MDDHKNKALNVALTQIERQFGKGSIMKMGGDVTHDIESISTGSISLDVALGIGGFAKRAYYRDFWPRVFR